MQKSTPIVDDLLLALNSQPRCELARMSGSGATCFAGFASAADAIKAAEAVHAEYPDCGCARRRSAARVRARYA